MKLSLLFGLGLCLSVVAYEDATPCDLSQCPGDDKCRCSSTDVPGGLKSTEIPLFVVLSFDDGVTITNYPFYEELEKQTNPNGCNIKMSFFVSHENSDYTLVNELHRKGHEIAVHSVTHKPDVENYWRKLNKDDWMKEMVDQREMLTTYANIPEEDIVGFRAPFLEVGGNEMYEALVESGFQYDCSWPSLKYTPWFQDTEGNVNGALWPYTLDYTSIQDQTVGTKPTVSLPGMWVAPMTDLFDFRRLNNRPVECSMLDACESQGNELETLPEAVADLLVDNFKAHMTERSPFGVYVHHSWFAHNASSNVRTEGFTRFLNYLKAYPFVYVVSVKQLLDWVKNPVPLSELGNLDSFKCDSNMPPVNCKDIINCQYNAPLPINQTEIYMKICQNPCPQYYPYLGNTKGMDPY